MPVESTGTFVVWPPLTDGQVDALIQRLEDGWAAGKLEASCRVFGQFLALAFPEQYCGDEDAVLIEAQNVRDRAEAKMEKPPGAESLRPMPNGHIPTYRPPRDPGRND